MDSEESRRHRADGDPDALTEAEARLPRLQDDQALERANVAQLGGVVEDRAALAVPPGPPPDPASPGGRRISLVPNQGELSFPHAARELLLDRGADDLRA